MVSSDDDDLDQFDPKIYERRVTEWSDHKLQQEMRKLQREIELEKSKKDRKKSKSPADDSDDDGEEEEESEPDEVLQNLSVAQLQAKFNQTANAIQGIDTTLSSQTGYKEDPSKLYCICRQPYDGANDMIQCDYCQEWYHLSCIGLSQDKLTKVEELKFKCPVCNGADPRQLSQQRNPAGVMNKVTFDSPKARTPGTGPLNNGHNPFSNGNGNGPRKNRRRFIADSASDTDGTHGHVNMNMNMLNGQQQRPMNTNTSTANKANYEKLVVELQNRFKEYKEKTKKDKKDLVDRLAKAKRDIDEERRKRIEVQEHMEEAKENSDKIIKSLADEYDKQKQKETQLITKLQKLEVKQKKYKDQASDAKKKMKAMKEDQNIKIQELENEIIPTWQEKVQKEKDKTEAERAKYIQLQQQTASQIAAYQQQSQTAYAETQRLRQSLNQQSAENAKTQNLLSQLQHKNDHLLNQATNNHNEWQKINQMKDEKIKSLEKENMALRQQNNQLRQNNSLPQVTIPSSNNSSSINTPRPPSPVKMPSTPSYLKFNELEHEELKMCRELCEKLLHANLFQLDHMASRANLTQDLFVSWVTNNGPQPTVINDLNQSQASQTQLPQLSPNKHLSMNCVRHLLIEVRKQLESINNEQNHDKETLTKVSNLLRDFQTASQNYEQEMQKFKMIQHNRLLEACTHQGHVLEFLCVTGTLDNGQPKSEWIRVTVAAFDQQNNRVTIQKTKTGDFVIAAIDGATLRIPENIDDTNTVASNNNNQNSNNSQNNNNNNNQNRNKMNNNNNQSPAMNGNQNTNTGNFKYIALSPRFVINLILTLLFSSLLLQIYSSLF